MMLKWAGQKDAAEYLTQQEEVRRQSLQQRNEQGRHGREVEEQLRQGQLEAQHVDEELASGDARDVKGYKGALKARDRNSFCFRNTEARIQRLLGETEDILRKEKEAETRELDDRARDDVKSYVENCKRRKRMSLAGRAMEKRHHAEVQEDMRQEELQKFRKEVRNRNLDARYVQLEKQKAMAILAIENLRHKGCTFAAMNPFASLLD